MPDESTRHEQGFTLIELLIAIVISGIVMSALATGFITTMRGTKDMHDRFVQSHDAQLLAVYFPTDVQSADPNLGVVDHTNPTTWTGCTGSGPSDENWLQLRWSETTTAGTTAFAVSYRTRLAGDDWQLVRYFCSGSTVKSEVVAHSLANPSTNPPVVTASGQDVKLALFAAPRTAGTYSYTFSGKMRTPAPVPAYPRVSSITRKLATPTNAGTVTWKVLFDRAVTGVDAGDFTTAVTGLTGVGAPAVVTVSSTEYTVSVSTGAGSGAIGLSLVDNNSIKDTTPAFNALGGTAAGDGNYTGQSYAIDRSAPTVTLINLAGTTPTSGPNVSWTVDFGEDVSGVDAADFSAVRSGVTGGSITVTPISSVEYTVTVGPVGGAGTIGLNLVDNNSIVDSASNALGGVAAGDGNFTGQVYTISGGAPAAPAVTNVQLVNKSGGTAGKLETGDSVVVTFSAMIKVSSFCSAWTGDGNDQSLTAGNVVTVRVTDSGSSDALTVLSTSCTFNFGSLNLAGDYVSGTVDYAGNGSGSNTPSTIAWDATNHKLTITLGKDSPNNKANAVASSTPVYTISPSVTDPYAQAVDPPTYTFPAAAKQF